MLRFKVILGLLCSFLLSAVPARAYDAADLENADAYYNDHSYQLALTEYEKFRNAKGSEDLTREVSFKWADSVVKAKDPSRQEEAQKTLEDLVASKVHDRWWAEAGVTLADGYIERDPYGKQAEIKTMLDNARDYWAGSPQVELARERFIAISFTLADFVTTRWGWYGGDIKPLRLGREKSIAPPDNQPNWGLQVLFEEILKVAKKDDDKARARYSLGMALINNYSSDPKTKEKIVEHFEKLLKDFPSSEWVDDAHYQLGMYFENQGDFVKAVETYRKFLSFFREGQSQFVNDIQRRLEDLTKPRLEVYVSQTFLPDSQIQFSMNHRNLSDAQLTLYKVDLAKELNLTGLSADYSQGFNNYPDLLRKLVDTGRYEGLPVEVSWGVKFKEEGKHILYSETKGLAEWRQGENEKDIDLKKGTLAAGAYLLVTSAAGKIQGYDLVLVSDLALVSKVTKTSALFFAVDAKTGKPAAGADIKYNYSYYNTQNNTVWDEGQGRTDENGMFKAVLRNPNTNQYNQQHTMFAVASLESKQAFIQNSYYNYGQTRGEWWLYAFSDRPAYRPGEVISFKGLLRRYNGVTFSAPGGTQVKARIYNAQGSQVKEASYTLNAYGSFDDTLTLDEKAVLGEYRMELYSVDGNTHLSSAVLFRLEEYKLPEFTVDVRPEPKDDGAAKGYRLGDTVKVEIDAQYYFGGPVANAQAEYLVYQEAYVHTYDPPKDYPWYYEINTRYRDYGYNRQLVKKEKLVTDAEGKAHFIIETPKDSGSDLNYHIEVRVVDQSRREIVGASDIKVTKNAFFVDMRAKQSLYSPGDKAQIAIKTMTANDEPVSVEGKVTVKINSWREPRITAGNTVPAGYDGREMFTKFVKTNERGEAVFEFEPGEDGYYSVEFTGFDDGREVKGVANVFVCSKSSRDIGYRYGGLQIITEKDTYQSGEIMRAMIVADKPDTWVLFTGEADEIVEAQVLHLEGSVKLIEIPVTDNFIPNIHLSALSADHYQLKIASLEVIVPPVKKFLNVKIISDKQTYSPQEKGSFEVFVTDQEGKPVSAEIALGLTDASVYYIQNEFVQDIRQFFYGEKRPLTIQTQASFYQRPYVRLVRSDKNELISDEELSNRQKNGADANQTMLTGAVDALSKDGAGGFAGGREMEQDFRKEKSSMMRASAPASNMAAMEDKASPERRLNVAQPKKAGNKLEEAFKQDADGAPLAEAQLRTDFRSTVIWQPSIVTDEEGKATINVQFPDSLTTWRATARAATWDTAIGNITHEVKSQKELMVRLQAPRFFTERDMAVVSALIDNMSDEPLTVSPVLQTEGINVTGLYVDGKFVKGEAKALVVPAHGQARQDWAVSAEKAGTAKITVTARSQKFADAMERSYPVIPHGIEKFLAQALVLKSDGQAEQTREITINIPKERIKQSTGLQITLSPSMAANLLDALPYLADYPYGCVEQTMSRFLPAVIVRKTMRDLGLSAQDVETYISDVMQPRNDPQGHPQRRTDTTYSQVDQMTKDGLKRLYDFQHTDGGWGWWKDGDSDRFMTAYVVWGLSLAREAGIDVTGNVLGRAVEFLQKNIVEEENNPDMLAWMLHAMAYADSKSVFEDKQRTRLWDMRDKLNPYSRALFALSEHRRGNQERSRTLAQNLINGIDEDKANGTAHWGESGIHYRWSEGGVEATAFVVKALAVIDPQSAYLDPSVKWLSLNRRGGRWKNTRDTAIAILSLADYLKASKELSPEYTYKVLLNGKPVREGAVNAQNALSFGRIIDIPADQIQDGENTIKVIVNGKGALYASAYAKYFTLEEGITAAGNEIFVERKYYKQSVAETLLKGYTEGWAPLKDGDELKSGDRVRVDVTLEAKNNYEYLISEDFKPAGLEAVALQSGSATAVMLDRSGRETGNLIPVYQEFRDQKAAFFISKLDQGKCILRYELRAEVPGEFHAMPNQSHAMYVPEIRANSDEMRIKVKD